MPKKVKVDAGPSSLSSATGTPRWPALLEQSSGNDPDQQGLQAGNHPGSVTSQLHGFCAICTCLPRRSD